MALFFLRLFIFSFLFANVALAGPSRGTGRDPKFVQKVVATLNSFKTYADLIDSLPRRADRQYLLKELGDAASLPVRTTFVEPGAIFFEMGDVRVTVGIKDLAKRRFTILKRDFTFEPGETAEANIAKMRRSLLAARSLLPTLLVPRAEATLGLLGMAARPLLSKWLIPGLIAGFATVTLWCHQGFNTFGACAGMGLEWPNVAYQTGKGLVYLTIDKIKFHFSAAAFDLQELKCQKGGGTGLSAVIQDEKRQSLNLDVAFTAFGSPASFTLKSPDGAQETFYFKKDWSPDPLKMPGYEAKIDARSFDLMAKGIQTLRFACFGGNNEDALQEYFYRTRKIPKIDATVQKEGVSAKTVQ